MSSTGTPIGFLIDDHDMHLSSQQLGDLRGIDANLMTQLQQVDKAGKKLGSAAPPVQQPVQPIGRRRHGFNQGQGGGSATRRSGPNAASVDKLADERMELVKYAVARVLTVLDKSQQERAKEVLSDHDIDLDFDELANLPPPQQPSNDNQPASPHPRFGRPAANDGETASETTSPPPAVMSHDDDAAVEVGPAPAAIPPPTQGTAKPPPTIPAPAPTQTKAPPARFHRRARRRRRRRRRRSHQRRKLRRRFRRPHRARRHHRRSRRRARRTTKRSAPDSSLRADRRRTRRSAGRRTDRQIGRRRRPSSRTPARPCL